MELIPAIDLRHGRPVRLRAGRDEERTVYAADLPALLAHWHGLGARRAHVVDLDAAFGEPPQRALLERLLAATPRPAIQLGGGLRDAAAIAGALALGCERAVVGSLLARRPAEFGELAHAHAGRLVPALDVQAGEVRIAGWRESSRPTLAELCAGLRGLPCPAVLVTDVERDGLLAGPNLELVRQVALASGLAGLVSGGVAGLDDLRRAAATPGVGGAIVGRALWEGRLDLAAALTASAAEVGA